MFLLLKSHSTQVQVKSFGGWDSDCCDVQSPTFKAAAHSCHHTFRPVRTEFVKITKHVAIRATISHSSIYVNSLIIFAVLEVFVLCLTFLNICGRLGGSEALIRAMVSNNA